MYFGGGNCFDCVCSVLIHTCRVDWSLCYVGRLKTALGFPVKINRQMLMVLELSKIFKMNSIFAAIRRTASIVVMGRTTSCTIQKAKWGGHCQCEWCEILDRSKYGVRCAVPYVYALSIWDACTFAKPVVVVVGVFTRGNRCHQLFEVEVWHLSVVPEDNWWASAKQMLKKILNVSSVQ